MRKGTGSPGDKSTGKSGSVNEMFNPLLNLEKYLLSEKHIHSPN